MNIGGKYSGNRMLGKGKAFLDARKGFQANQDKAQLAGWQSKVANTGAVGRWASTGMIGKDASSAARLQQMAAIDASGTKHDMKRRNKTDLVGMLADSKYNEYEKQAGYQELASRGLADFDEAEMATTAGLLGIKNPTLTNKQALYDKYSPLNPNLENIAMDKHKDLILESSTASGDLKNKALNKILDSSLTSINSGEMKAAIKMATAAETGGGDITGDFDLPSTGDSIKDMENKREAYLASATGQAYLAKGMSKEAAIDSVQSAVTAQKVVKSWTPQQVSAVLRGKGEKRIKAITDAYTGASSEQFQALLREETREAIKTRGMSYDESSAGKADINADEDYSI